MRYLIFGDVHGNLPALEKLLKVEKNNYDQLISHGDVVNYGPWSNECVELLNSLPNIITLKGNHEDNYLIGSYSGKNEVAKAFFEYCYPRFSQFDTIKNYIESCDLKNFRVKHTVNENYIFPDTDLSPLNLKYNFIIGHSHYQFDRTIKNKRIINTGSIGQNRKFINVAEYIVYDEINDLIELKSFIYNIDTVIKEMEIDNYPELCLNYYKNKSRA
jgi:predicted phosphodiesterase